MWGYLAVAALLCCSSLFSQSIILEEFSYPAGDSLASHGWDAHASAGTNPVRVVTPGLSYAGYPGSGVGNAVRLVGTGEDVNKAFSGQADSDLYVSFLIVVQDATTGSTEHFLHLNIGTHVGRIYVKKSGGSLAFGAAKSSEGAVFTEFDYEMNVVYLVVLRYTHSAGNDNDAVRLYMFESGVPAVEPESATIGPLVSPGTEPSGITTVALRQGGSTVTDVVLDGLRIATSWEDAGLPVTFSLFKANRKGKDVELVWRTESEVENYGFEVERRTVSMEYGVGSREKTNQRKDESPPTCPPSFWRKADQPLAETNQRHSLPLRPPSAISGQAFTVHPSPWAKIGFVQGSGTSSSPKDYSFVDKPDQPGRYAYRIKQIDHSGSSIHTSTLEVVVGLAPLEFTLAQNYPNPFNPTTTIGFTLPEDGHVVLKIYNLQGQEMATLLDEQRNAGHYHQATIDASRFVSGTYFCRVQFKGSQLTRKILLVK